MIKLNVIFITGQIIKMPKAFGTNKNLNVFTLINSRPYKDRKGQLQYKKLIINIGCNLRDSTYINKYAKIGKFLLVEGVLSHYERNYELKDGSTKRVFHYMVMAKSVEMYNNEKQPVSKKENVIVANFLK